MEMFHKLTIKQLIEKIYGNQLQTPILEYATIILCQKLLKEKEYQQAESCFNKFLLYSTINDERINKALFYIKSKINQGIPDISFGNKASNFDQELQNCNFLVENYLHKNVGENDTNIDKEYLTEEETKEEYLTNKINLLINLLKQKYNIYIKAQEHFLKINEYLFDQVTYDKITKMHTTLNSLTNNLFYDYESEHTFFTHYSKCKSFDESKIIQLQKHIEETKEEFDPIVAINEKFNENINKLEAQCSLILEKLDKSFELKMNHFK